MTIADLDLSMGVNLSIDLCLFEELGYDRFLRYELIYEPINSHNPACSDNVGPASPDLFP
ncbi:hypothetical protein GCM10028807_34790 [Spirosoma daeguense]